MTAYVMRALNVSQPEANHLRQHYWQTYGTTLSGLMHEHALDPTPYLQDVHDIPLDRLQPDPRLAAAIGALPGRKIVYTNGAAAYGERVLAARGLAGQFDRIYGIEHANYLPKPETAAFLAIFEQDALIPTGAAMFEDDPRNLAAPHALGMRTIHIAPEPEPAPHIHHHGSDLTAFLQGLLA